MSVLQRSASATDSSEALRSVMESTGIIESEFDVYNDSFKVMMEALAAGVITINECTLLKRGLANADELSQDILQKLDHHATDARAILMQDFETRRRIFKEIETRDMKDRRCIVCQESFTDYYDIRAPYILECGHSICGTCVGHFLGSFCPIDHCPIPLVMSDVQVNIVRLRQQRHLNRERVHSDAIAIVGMIKKRCSAEIYQKFLEDLRSFRDNREGVPQCIDQMFATFSEHPDLIERISSFVPAEYEDYVRSRLIALRSSSSSTAAAPDAAACRDKCMVAARSL